MICFFSLDLSKDVVIDSAYCIQLWLAKTINKYKWLSDIDPVSEGLNGGVRGTGGFFELGRDCRR